MSRGLGKLQRALLEELGRYSRHSLSTTELVERMVQQKLSPDNRPRETFAVWRALRALERRGLVHEGRSAADASEAVWRAACRLLADNSEEE